MGRGGGRGCTAKPWKAEKLKRLRRQELWYLQAGHDASTLTMRCKSEKTRTSLSLPPAASCANAQPGLQNGARCSLTTLRQLS